MSNIDKYETRKKMVYDFMCDDMYQYVSATPAIVPSPADLPSWKRITIVITKLTIINNTDKTIFKVATIRPPNFNSK